MNYLIYSRKHTVHTPVWWGPNNAGYWEDLAGAGRYPADVSTVAYYSDKSASAENVAIPEEKVLALPQPVTVNALEAMLAGRESSKLDGINRAFMLRAALQRVSRAHRRGRPLWGIVSELCGVGSTSASEICRELNWNPDASATEELP